MANINAEIEAYIRSKTVWESLPPAVQQQQGNSPKEYEKSIVQFSIRNQLRYRGNLVRHVKKDEKRYYEELVDYSRKNLMLFPYHLSDVVVKGLRITPFQYYIMMLESIMQQEKSYDSLPNFTAVDCLRLLGIGRNQYIELMNKTRTKSKFGAFSTNLFRRSYKELLPSRPVSEIPILPWWVVQVGYITEDDVRVLTSDQKSLIDQIIDKGPCPAGQLNYEQVHSLYLQGLLYLDIIIDDNDRMIVPPLEGFVMNRVTGDYFETLLYKIFVSMDENTNVSDMASLLQIDLGLVKDAVSLYCRLGFAKKKNVEMESDTTHPSWYDVNGGREIRIRTGSVTSVSSDEEDSLLKELNRALEIGEEIVTDVKEGIRDDGEEPSATKAKKIAFLFDSTLTAYLMMGNLSPSLKKHAVTMFEVGKLAEESLDVFLAELDTISTSEAEGEAGVYFTAALTLRETIASLRYCSGLKEQDLCLGLDLVRCESLQSLDSQTVGRLLKKNYSLLVCTAPLCHQFAGLPELSSAWFKLFLYELNGEGPASLLLPKGWKMRCLPKPLANSSMLLVTTWGHEPTQVPTAGALAMLQDALLHSPVLLQVYNEQQEQVHIKHLPFPLDQGLAESITKCLTKLESQVDIVTNCGFLTLISIPSSKHTKLEETEKIEEQRVVSREGSPSGAELDSSTAQLLEEELDNIDCPMAGGRTPPQRPQCLDLGLPQRNHDKDQEEHDWQLLDLTFGIPLFDMDLNAAVTSRIVQRGLVQPSSLAKLNDSSSKLSDTLLAFIKLQTDDYVPYVKAMIDDNEVPFPTRPVWFDGKQICSLGPVINK